MVFKRFRSVCLVRILLLTVTLAAVLYLLFRHELQMFAILLCAAALYQVYSLIRYVDHTNRDLARFFDSVKYEDFSQAFRDEGLGPSFSALRAVFAEIMSTLGKTRAEKEEHAHYLQTVVQHVGSGLLVFQSNGDVELINTAAKRLLKVPWLKNITGLNSLSPELAQTLSRLAPREKALVKIEDEKEAQYLALYATEFRLRGRDLKLVSIQNIHRELEEREMEAWQKLIRVITHEIMNSVTPISTLASTISGLITAGSPALGTEGSDDTEVKRDIREAAQTIEKRSQGLLHFVDAFRSLTLLPKPQYQVFPLKELFGRVGRLMDANISGKNIRFSVCIEPETLELEADPELIEQVLINLLLNALQAVEGRPEPALTLKAFLSDRGRIIVQVIDNGPGVPPENLEKIFIPFFSTKPGGSGIGLSLSRQIMRLHRGTIHVHSEAGAPTVFTLSF